MKRYKVGDKVRVKVFKERPFHWVSKMDKWMGQEVTVKHIECDEDIRIYEDIGENGINGWYWESSDFEEVNFLTDKDIML